VVSRLAATCAQSKFAQAAEEEEDEDEDEEEESV
jgi:hypothetical protein